jgi:osmotically-inducible protein OsmY
LWDPKVDSEAIAVSADVGTRLFIDTTSYGRVTLAGSVSSWAEHDEAVDAAWSAPGVTEVDDQIQVAY